MNYPGYTLVRREDCPEQHGVLTVLNHDVSGATVLLVENEDTNKAFGIGFGTFPSDDTGVFHILEHSVLAGSEKYPVTSPFLQLLKSSMASFLNAMTFPDKTVYPFATPNETDFRNLMDVYLNAVFCPLAMVDKAVFEQEGWHRDADGTVSGVVYNEMQGALASPDAQLQNALERAMFPDTAYGFVSGGDPASIPALTYEKYQRVYRRHYSADNCCITLYGKMDMAEKLAFLDEHYLSRMPKGTSRPRLTVQDQQNGVRVHIPYYTENPEPDQVQCALAWYTGAFADRERQLGVEILLDALLGTNQSPLKAALLEQKLGADIDIGFDDSTLQPTLELVLRGATAETAPKFAAGVKQAVTDLLAGGIPEELLLASLNAMEFASLERPGSLPDGVLDAIYAATGWLHTGDPALLLHTDKLFASLREKLSTGWFNDLLKDLLLAEPVQGEAGVRPPRPGYLDALRRRCDEVGALLIFDEIQTGMGRTGALFAMQRYGVTPDIVCLAKAFGGGMPLGAFVSSREIMEGLSHHPALGHITTFGGHPVCCAAGLAALEYLLENDVVAGVEAKGSLYAELLGDHPAVREIRRSGLLLAVELGSSDKLFRIMELFGQAGILSDWFLFCDTAFRISPPLTITEEEVRDSARLIRTCLDRL